MSKSPLSMPRPGWLTSSHGDHWHSSPQAWRVWTTELELVPVGTVLLARVGDVRGGRVELTTEDRREGGRAKSLGVFEAAPHPLSLPPCPSAALWVSPCQAGVTVSTYNGRLERASTKSPGHTWLRQVWSPQQLKEQVN